MSDSNALNLTVRLPEGMATLPDGFSALISMPEELEIPATSLKFKDGDASVEFGVETTASLLGKVISVVVNDKVVARWQVPAEITTAVVLPLSADRLNRILPPAPAPVSV